MKGTEPVDTVFKDSMPEGRLWKDGASKDGLLEGNLRQDLASTGSMPEGIMPKCTMPKGGMHTDTVPRDDIRGQPEQACNQGHPAKGPPIPRAMCPRMLS